MKSDLDNLLDLMVSAGQPRATTESRVTQFDPKTDPQNEPIVYLTSRPKGARVRFQRIEHELD